MADDYVDDVYFSRKDAHREATEPKPVYKNGIKEIVFIDEPMAIDSSSVQHNDTISNAARVKAEKSKAEK